MTEPNHIVKIKALPFCPLCATSLDLNPRHATHRFLCESCAEKMLSAGIAPDDLDQNSLEATATLHAIRTLYTAAETLVSAAAPLSTPGIAKETLERLLAEPDALFGMLACTGVACRRAAVGLGAAYQHLALEPIHDAVHRMHDSLERVAGGDDLKDVMGLEAHDEMRRFMRAAKRKYDGGEFGAPPK